MTPVEPTESLRCRVKIAEAKWQEELASLAVARIWVTHLEQQLRLAQEQLDSARTEVAVARGIHISLQEALVDAPLAEGEDQ
jgi:hypothetical protein